MSAIISVAGSRSSTLKARGGVEIRMAVDKCPGNAAAHRVPNLPESVQSRARGSVGHVGERRPEAAAIAAMPGTFSIPARRLRSLSSPQG
jgi:hypothetical protein